MRRSECAALTVGDLHQEQGHHIALLRHTKGDKRRKIKIPVDVWRVIEDYLVAVGHYSAKTSPSMLQTPLFVQFRKGDHPQIEGTSD